MTAWFGGYVPGALTCLITMVGIPLLATPGFRLRSVDPSRLILLIGVSVLVSLVANPSARSAINCVRPTINWTSAFK